MVCESRETQRCVTYRHDLNLDHKSGFSNRVTSVISVVLGETSLTISVSTRKPVLVQREYPR